MDLFFELLPDFVMLLFILLPFIFILRLIGAVIKYFKARTRYYDSLLYAEKEDFREDEQHSHGG